MGHQGLEGAPRTTSRHTLEKIGPEHATPCQQCLYSVMENCANRYSQKTYHFGGNVSDSFRDPVCYICSCACAYSCSGSRLGIVILKQ